MPFHQFSKKKWLRPTFLGLGLLIALEANSVENTDTQSDKICSSKSEPTNISGQDFPAEQAPLTPELRERISTWLDWQDFNSVGCGVQKGVKGKYNACGGLYKEPVLEGFSPQLPTQNDARVSANEARIQAEGQSTLVGDVVVVQPEKQMTADTAYIYRDPQTKQITQIDLFGHVSFREPGRVMYGTEGHYLPKTEQGYLNNALYRISLAKPQQLESSELLQAWGRAVSVERDKQIYYLKDATYTTCPPKDSAWHVKAKKLKLNKETGRGEASHATLNFKDWPIFYFPYYNFPIDDRRQSGFLVPSTGYSNNLGISMSAPYYWNMAPNYDLLLTPSYYSLRGFDLKGDFRYLTEKSDGELVLSGLPNDQKFEQFVQDNESETGDLSNNRYEVFFKDKTSLNSNLSINARYHLVSDDYYMQDFGSTVGETTENQLLQQADIDYQDEHWTSVAMMQHFQTLQPFNQTYTEDVYSRYPSWSLNGYYGDLPKGLNFNINNQYDNFVWTGSNSSSQALGSRYHTNPVFGLPILDQSGYIKPMIQLQETYYGLSQNPTDLDQSLNVLIPQASVDTGFYLDRNAQFLGKNWTQTLEPRMYYLYTPNVDQTALPNFDTSYYIFTYDQLFRSNRFVGLDRVGDANQVTLALMSRFLDADSGSETFHWGVGQIYYFEDREVQLMQQEPGEVYADSPTTTAGYASPTDSSSPIASQIAYHFNSDWSLIGDGAWDPNTSQANNATANLHYQPGVNQIINIGYSFLLNGDQTGISDTTIQSDNLNQTIFSFAWPFTANHQWSALGSWTQNISHDYPMNYSLGVQYEDCCWAVRFLGGKIYSSLDENNNPVYNNGVYLQLLLKGLGNVAEKTPAAAQNIPGYQDIFN